MTDDEDLALNGIDRFEKTSPNATLEIHSHCEVPAGCGGAVLRWVDTRAALPVRILVYLEGTGGLMIDGEEPSSSRPLLAHGPHVLAIELVGRAFAVAAVRDDVEHPRDYGLAPERVLVRTASDGTWRYTTQEPPDDWMQPGFDEAGWRTLSEVELDAGSRAWSLQRIRELGAVGLGIHGEAHLWVRRAFEVEP